MAVIEITQENFKDLVLKEEKTVLLYFWVSGSESCKIMDPIVEEISREMKEVMVCSINKETNPNLSDSFRIKTIPTLVIMTDGAVVRFAAGVQTKTTLLNMLKKNLRR